MYRPNKNNPYQKARENAQLTQEEAVEHLPVEIRTLQYYESGRRQPKVDCANAMAELYGCSVGYFVQKEEQEGKAEEQGMRPKANFAFSQKTL